MERLTEKRESGAWPKKGWTNESLAECLDRLAAYEDTSLEPEEVSDFDRLVKLYLEAGLDKQFVLACIEATKAGMTVDRLRELAQADREGRVEIIEPDVYECVKTVRKAQAALRREQDEQTKP